MMGVRIPTLPRPIANPERKIMFIRSFIACVFAFAASTAFAQQAEVPAEAASTTQNCVKRHDHGAERQAPSIRKDCKPAAAKVATADKKKDKVQGHDHGKFHKNQ
jgi:hypothetical protein